MRYCGAGPVIIDSEEIIGVFDAYNSTSSAITREYLKKREAADGLISAYDGEPRYIIVTSARTSGVREFVKRERKPKTKGQKRKSVINATASNDDQAARHTAYFSGVKPKPIEQNVSSAWESKK